MISSQKLIGLARKLQMLAGLRRKKISSPQVSSMKNDTCSSSSTASKGHFVSYSIDGRRFEIPLKYLRNQLVAELLQAAEEEFGVARNGPLTLPCDEVLVEYVLSLVGKSTSEDMQKQLAASIAGNRCLSYSHLVQEYRPRCQASGHFLCRHIKGWLPSSGAPCKRSGASRSASLCTRDKAYSMKREVHGKLIGSSLREPNCSSAALRSCLLLLRDHPDEGASIRHLHLQEDSVSKEETL
ncbi:Auxin-responsive protein SAUR66-like protein [Drosera capensis]